LATTGEDLGKTFWVKIVD